ncbi:NUDIX domain-containing protein [Streptococcus hillyeri]|uniref:NUDIX domain-containing protein n=1 Tax=Streptococcus hillyeri TaxID=2282420 RepID=A0A3L9DWZ4_9STRE|nr:NUDIX domain-containing protein [Streptococcus hillyeri]RLY04798.1 NUDIX domain-containing protein [Streptococcus hillyeri]
MRASVILLDKTGQFIVLIKRIKPDKTYLVFPGGGIEAGETPRQAALRELSEELAIQVPSEAIRAEMQQQDGWLFLIQSQESVGPLAIHGEEAERSTPKNQYLPHWISLEEMAELSIFPEIDREWLARQLN